MVLIWCLYKNNGSSTTSRCGQSKSTSPLWVFILYLSRPRRTRPCWYPCPWTSGRNDGYGPSLTSQSNKSGKLEIFVSSSRVTDCHWDKGEDESFSETKCLKFSPFIDYIGILLLKKVCRLVFKCLVKFWPYQISL